ncbi:hypothetical protein GGS21DRAFT_525026 [Xylaria nigripes]|nr:hypothetical protein GGS21DRAFT_525026 [Xylaria nigripes]
MTKSTRLASRIAYSSAYAVLCLLLSALLLVVPGDLIRQALTTTHQVINLIVLAVVYVPTFLIVLFIYALRLYVTRTVLASIPKPWIPIEKGDVDQEVRDMIVNHLDRSAAIALEARPKFLAPPPDPDPPLAPASSIAEEGDVPATGPREAARSTSLSRPEAPATVTDDMGISFRPSAPSRHIWGEVEHHGWSSPASPDLPNLQYGTVLAELPNLIEAKAVAQAPTDPNSVSHEPLLDADAVLLLQRSPEMTVRSYIAHLTELDVLPASQGLAHFLDLYERVRFSGRPMSNATFRRLMQLFADLLRAMQPLDPSIVNDQRDDSSSYFGFDGHIDDDAPRDSIPTTPSRSIRSSGSFDRGSIRSNARAPSLAGHNSSISTTRQYGTAPTTPMSHGQAGEPLTTRSLSTNSGRSSAQSRLYAANRSNTSLVSTSHGSVIRLSTAQDAIDLPYVLQLSDTF